MSTGLVTVPDLMDDPRGIPPQGRVWCGGTAKSTGKPCKLLAIPGGTVCRRYHGGAAPQVERRAAERERERLAQEALHAGLEEAAARWRGTHPIESAEEARAISAATMEELFRRLADPDLDGVVVERRGKDGGVVSTSLQVTFTMEQLRAWTELAGKLSKGSLDAGVAERTVQLAEGQREWMGAVVLEFVVAADAALEGAGLADAQALLRESWRSWWAAAEAKVAGGAGGESGGAAPTPPAIGPLP